MPRIAGIDIPNDKRIEIALRYIYGVGPHLAGEILKEAGIDSHKVRVEVQDGRIIISK